MSTEKQLIDANALLEELDKFANPMPNKSGYDFLCGVATVITEIENAPTVDAVEVVRCQDCDKISPSVTPIKDAVWCREFRAYMPCGGFCSHGERRQGE